MTFHRSPIPVGKGNHYPGTVMLMQTQHSTIHCGAHAYKHLKHHHETCSKPAYTQMPLPRENNLYYTFFRWLFTGLLSLQGNETTIQALYCWCRPNHCGAHAYKNLKNQPARACSTQQIHSDYQHSLKRFLGLITRWLKNLAYHASLHDHKNNTDTICIHTIVYVAWMKSHKSIDAYVHASLHDIGTICIHAIVFAYIP